MSKSPNHNHGVLETGAKVPLRWLGLSLKCHESASDLRLAGGDSQGCEPPSLYGRFFARPLHFRIKAV
jgi:hypothetical protein